MRHLAEILPAAVAAILFPPERRAPESWQYVRMLWRADGGPRALWRRQDPLDVTVYQVTGGTREDGPPPVHAIGFQAAATVIRLAGASLEQPQEVAHHG